MKYFLFKADVDKAFRKLKDHQLGNPGRWVWEILANAFDTMGGDRSFPVEVTLRKRGATAKLVVSDAGEGLNSERLLGLYLIGRSAKTAKRAETIGRYGMGFLSVFHEAAKMKKVTIDTRYDGQDPMRIVYACRGREVPLWQLEDVGTTDVPERGCRFTFEFAAERAGAVEEELMAFCKRTVIPVNFNGQTYVQKPDRLRRGDGVLVQHTEPGIDVYLATSVENQYRSTRDHVEINVRQMPTHEGSAFHLFTCSGDKMIQNSYGSVYLPDEDILLVTTIGEPTVGRCTLVRDDSFGRIRAAVEAARAKALVKVLSPEGSRRPLGQRVKALVLANLYALRGDVGAFLENRLDLEKRGYLAEALSLLVQTPVFNTHGSRSGGSLISARALYRDAAAHNVHLHAETQDVAAQFDHTCPFTLDAGEHLPADMTGWHALGQAKDVAAGILAQCKQRTIELVAMEDVMWSSATAQKMEDRGVIQRHSIQVETLAELELESELQAWLGELRTVLNRPAFRQALASRYRAVRRVRLQPVDVSIAAEGQERTIPLAMFLRPSASCPSGDLRIGIRVHDESLRALARQGRQGCLQFLPVLAESISAYAYGTFVLQSDSPLELAHTTSMLLDRVACADRLVDVGLAEAVKILAGEDDAVGGESAGELVII